MKINKILLSSLSISLISASVIPPHDLVKSNSHKRPIVIWHGMGDRYDSAGIQSVVTEIKSIHKDIQVHVVRLDEDGSEDQKQTILGVVDEQIDEVCEQLKEIPGLENGFDGIGFSQGGLFLRGYAERCNDPPLKTLVTFGSPHNGIADVFYCGEREYLCKQRNKLIISQIFTEYAQTHSVNAQYFRDPENYSTYLNRSHFLADINNEREVKNVTYKNNLSTLEQLVLIKFSDDTTVIPKQSSWFQEYNKTTQVVTPLEKRKLYTEDWLGLKTLGERNAIVYIELEGAHMQFSTQDLRLIVSTYLGNSNGDKDAALDSDTSRRLTTLWADSAQYILGFFKKY